MVRNAEHRMNVVNATADYEYVSNVKRFPSR